MQLQDCRAGSWTWCWLLHPSSTEQQEAMQNKTTCAHLHGRRCGGASGVPHHHTRLLPELALVVSVNTPRVAHSFIHAYLPHRQQRCRAKVLCTAHTSRPHVCDALCRPTWPSSPCVCCCRTSHTTPAAHHPPTAAAAAAVSDVSNKVEEYGPAACVDVVPARLTPHQLLASLLQ
jgi:hypothetical protein